MFYSMKGSASSSPENNAADANSPPPSTGRASPLMPSGMTTPPSSNNILFRPQQMGQFSPPVTSTPTSNTVLSVSTSPPSSLLNQPTDNHLHHLSLAERMSMSLLSHHARPMNLLCAPQPKVRDQRQMTWRPQCKKFFWEQSRINCRIGLVEFGKEERKKEKENN